MRVLDSDVGPINVVASLADAATCWDWLRAQGPRYLGLDAETNAHNPWSPTYRLRTVQLSNGIPGGAWVIQHEKPELYQAGVVRALVSSHPRWVAHYAGFADIRFLARGAPGSIRLDSVEAHVSDTQTVLAYFDPRTVTGGAKLPPGIRLPAGLKPSVERILGTDVLTRGDVAMGEKVRSLAPVGSRTPKASRLWGFEHLDIDDDDYLRYAGLDAVLEIQLFERMMAEIYRRGLGPLVLAELRRQWHIDLMVLRGMSIDLPYARWLDGELSEVVRQQTPRLFCHQVGQSGMGPAVGRAFDALGVRSTRTTGGSDPQPSWDADMLEIITDAEHLVTQPNHVEAVELAKSIQLVRKSTKFRSSYIKPMLLTAERDGRVHPGFRLCGAVTGRNSASEPPVQQIPKRRDKRVRPAFVAPPGWLIVSCDFAQGEPSMMAAKSGDANLRRAILAGDINSELARVTYGERFIYADRKTPGTVSFDLRQRGKAGFLAWCFGCGLAKLGSAKLLKVSTDEARAIEQNWINEYPDLRAYADQLNSQAYITLDSGRIVPLWDRYEPDGQGGVRLNPRRPTSRLGLNADSQGELADRLREAMDRFVELGWSWALYCLIHDEIVACVPTDMAEECRITLEKCMTMNYHGFPLRCEATIEGTSWMPRPDNYDSADTAALVAGMED